ncbi:CG0192-related protein [Motilibacter deserti]|uniref:Maltokinase N-terminal cap domain-containing protein n=1 Tax=Motilibacter deserti TaxID=2714956 RepID=A0ABX0GXD0_9ACTN|nr:hypothetical protein [Motilibacter deserti]NHC14270.1 hypothetical protein [Motilibacter deserti]
MALIHKAELHPTKLELLAAWLPTRPWSRGAGNGLERVGAYRFDDPDGEVGIETFLVRGGEGPTLQVPLTYRGAPLEDAQEWLVGTTEHSVLGTRWVYDAAHDPVYAAALARTVLTGGTEAVEYYEVDGRQEARASLASVRGSGAPGTPVGSQPLASVDDADPTVLRVAGTELAVLRVVGPGGTSAAPAGAGPVLTGTWAGQEEPALLAYAVGR